jgi:dolichol-phosphate mannosyltransferase
LAKSFHYTIHGIVTIASDVILPEIEPFRTSDERAAADLAAPTLRVRIGQDRRPAAEQTPEARRITYNEGFGPMGFRVQIEIGEAITVWASPMLRLSPHVLYTNVVEPILRWTFVEKGYALVHSACLAFGDRAFFITARTDTGKTTTLLRILSRQRRSADTAAFVSDDLTLLSAQGEVLTYPKPLTISSHTVHAINATNLPLAARLYLPFQSRVHSRNGRRAAHYMAQTKLPMATVNAYVQFLIPPPKFTVGELVPTVKMVARAHMAGLYVIEREGGDTVRDLDSAEALDILMCNCEDAYGFPPYRAIESFLYTSHGQDLRVVERQIVASALDHLPATLIRSKTSDWARQILERVA